MAAGWVLERVLQSRSPADLFLEGAVARFEGRDQALLRELVFGTLRWLGRLDHVISAASHREFSEIDERLHAPLRLGAYQLLFLDRVPAHAAVHEAVDQALSLTHRGGASFVNAVLRRIARAPSLDEWPVEVRDPVRRLAIEHSHPEFLVRRWLNRFGEERTADILAANNRAKPWHLLAFRDRGGRELLAEALIDEGYEVVPSSLSPLGLRVRGASPLESAAFRRGDAYVQDEASQVAAVIPPPVRGERIADLCGAPGGKTFALLAFEPELEIVLADVSLERLDTLRENASRLGRSVRAVVTDSGTPGLGPVFDRVVLDLPCSGTGTLRKHPEIKWRLSPEEIGRLSEQGVAMALGAAELVVPGGLLVIVTCSLESEENEDVVAALLDRREGLELHPLDELDQVLAPWREGPGRWRLPPGGDHDGFTVHVLSRRS